MKRLLHVVYSGQGGLGTYFINFVNDDRNKRFQHHVAFYGIEKVYPEYKEFCVQRGIPYVVIERAGRLSFNFVPIINQFILNNKIDIVIFHTFSVTPLIFRLPNVIKIAIDHTPVKVKTKLEWIYTLLQYVYSDLFISFYDDQFNALKGKFPFLNKKYSGLIIPKTVDINEFIPEAAGAGERSFTLGMSARLIAGKRQEVLIQAIALLKQKHILVYCRIAGSGPREDELKTMANALGVSDVVEFTGSLKRNEMISFYQSLDLYVHITEGETICYCIMEAQACGLPILASDVSGVNNVLTHHESALLVRNNAEELAAAIEYAVLNTSVVKHLGEQSRQMAIDLYLKYNAPDMIGEWLFKKEL